jgi:hypothetical protein
MLRGSTNTTATSARCAPERALSGTGAELLQGAAAGMLASTNVIDLRADRFLKPFVDRGSQHFAPILRTPHKVVFSG